MKAAVRKKCIVMNCANHTDEGSSSAICALPATSS